VELFLHFPIHLTSWRLVKHRDNFTFNYMNFCYISSTKTGSLSHYTVQLYEMTRVSTFSRTERKAAKTIAGNWADLQTLTSDLEARRTLKLLISVNYTAQPAWKTASL
jgi:hypothetical protein